MALESIPPWLNVTPESFVRAAQMGAETGIAARRQYSSELQAADRLRLAYDTLASEERRANERAAQQQELAAMKLDYQMQQNEAAMALREQQAASLDAYRQARLGQFQTEEERRQKASTDLESFRQQRLALQSQRQADLARKAEDLRTWRQNVEARRMAEWSPPDRAEFQYNLNRLSTIQRELDKESQFGVLLDPDVKQRLIDESLSIYDTMNALRQRYPSVSTRPTLEQPAATTGVSGLLQLQPSPTENLTLNLPGAGGSLSMSTGPSPTMSTAEFGALLPSPAAGTVTTGRVFTDKTGTRWLYTGTAADPKTDTNPDNWQEQ